MKRSIIKRVNFSKRITLRRRKKPPVQRGESIDYKNQGLLRKFVSEQGKILSRRVSRLTSKQQRTMARFIKSARILAFMPFLNNES